MSVIEVDLKEVLAKMEHFASASQGARTIKDYKIDRFILYPEHWRNYPNTISLKWEKVKFTQDNAKSIPNNQAGVYSFVVDAETAQHPACSYLLYIGKTRRNFRKRYREYLRETKQSKPRMHILKMINNFPEHLWFHYAPILDEKLISQLEDDLITAFLPPINQRYPASISRIMELVFK